MNQILYTPWQIEDVVDGIATHLNTLYDQQNEDEVVLAPILQGAVPFFSDISRNLLFNPYVDYIGVSSYDGEEQTQFNLYKAPDRAIVKDRTVWLFDDIADSGNTLQFMKNVLLSMGAKEVKTCVLLKKNHCTYPVDLYGFPMNDEWVWGYGMDAPDGRGRLLNAIFCR
jgi:hypoxanthine phosphoribosyltransferase